MSEVLSQVEIDELFAQMNAGEIDVNEIKESRLEKNIRTYDFSRPSKFSKDQLRTLNAVFESYARSISTYLSGYLGVMVPVEVVSSEALTFREFSSSLSEPLLMGIIHFNPLPGSVIAEMMPSIGFAILDKILGGKGKSIDKIREFTKIEKMILSKIFEQFSKLLNEPWENIISLDAKLEKLETNPQVVQIISPSEMVALVSLKITIGQAEGLLNICIPYLVIEDIMDKLSAKNFFSNMSVGKRMVKKNNEIEDAIQETKVIVRVVLGETNIMLEDFLELGINDVIKLDASTSEDIKVYVGDLLKFAASPGTKKDKSAIRINHILTRED